MVRSTDKLESLETGYVVNIHEAFYPSSKVEGKSKEDPSIQDLFTFSHPNLQHRDADAEHSNDRYAEAAFEMEVDALVHGFAGYFHCKLYNDVTISIDPRTFSKGMFSWFEMYMPLHTPILVKKGDRICSHWWRRHIGTKAWYEWALSEPTATPLQNPGGRSWTMDFQ